jgi:hypothetical protein
VVVHAYRRFTRLENGIDVKPRKAALDWPKLWSNRRMLALEQAPGVAQNQAASYGDSGERTFRCVAGKNPRPPLQRLAVTDNETCGAVAIASNARYTNLRR